MRTLVIIPTFNERENLAAIVTGALAHGGAETSALIIDDASPDGTGAVAGDLATDNPSRVFVLHRAGKLGLGSAYLEGFRFALEHGFAAACTMDADGSHDAADLPGLIGLVADGADLAIGSRRVPGGRVIGWGPHRHLMSAGAMAVSRLALGLATRDVTSGFRCYSAKLIAGLLAKPIIGNGYAFQEETVFYAERLGVTIKETPITFRDRVRGSSKLTWREIAQFFSVIVSLRRRR